MVPLASKQLEVRYDIEGIGDMQVCDTDSNPKGKGYNNILLEETSAGVSRCGLVLRNTSFCRHCLIVAYPHTVYPTQLECCALRCTM